MSSIRITSHSGARRDRGFTLVEIMVAMFILALVFAGAISSYLTAYRKAHAAKATFRATSLINTRMEAMRALSFDTLVSQLDNSTTNQGSITDTSVTGAHTFTWKAEKTTTETDFIAVTVTVSWKEERRSHTLSSVTYFYRNGLASKGLSS